MYHCTLYSFLPLPPAVGQWTFSPKKTDWTGPQASREFNSPLFYSSKHTNPSQESYDAVSLVRPQNGLRSPTLVIKRHHKLGWYLWIILYITHMWCEITVHQSYECISWMNTCILYHRYHHIVVFMIQDTRMYDTWNLFINQSIAHMNRTNAYCICNCIHEHNNEQQQTWPHVCPQLNWIWITLAHALCYYAMPCNGQ